MWRLKYYIGLLLYWFKILDKVELGHNFITGQKPRKHCRWIRKISEPFRWKVIVGYNIVDATRMMREERILPKDCILLSGQDVDSWRHRLTGIHHLRDEDVFGITLSQLEYETKTYLRN